MFLQYNYINLAMASNNEWVVPAGMMERRFMVLDVPNKCQQDKRYFGAIARELQNGGIEAMLYDLLEWDVSTVDFSQVLQTAAGFDQKLASMDPIQKFWFEKLRSGQLRCDGDGWGEIISRREFYQQHLDFCEDIGVRFRATDAQFGKALRKICPGISQKNLATNSNSGGDGKRERYHQFPIIDVCRENFEKKVGLEIEWDSDQLFINGEFI